MAKDNKFASPSSPTAKTTLLWYLRSGNELEGPYTSDKLKAMLKDGSMSWLKEVWSPGGGLREWIPLHEFPEFQEHLTEQTKNDILLQSAKHNVVPKAAEGEQQWYIQFKDGRSGPFSVSEVESVLSFKNVKPPVKVWKEGMKEWLPIQEVRELKPVKTVTPKAKKGLTTRTSSIDRRIKKRGVLMASVSIPAAGKSTIGICRNISETGMQILGSYIPGGVGSKHYFEVHPTPGLGVPDFGAHGIVRRILTTRPGFAIEFVDLPQKIIAALKKHF